MNSESRMQHQSRKRNSFHKSVFFVLILSILIGASLAACATKPLAGELIISVSDAYQLYQDDAFMLDVRTPEEYQAGHIPGATLIPLDQLSVRYGELPLDETIVVYCRSGNRSLEAVYLLENAGFKWAHSMNRGINNWISLGYEVEK